MAAKKIYTLEINGVEKNIKDFTTLEEAINRTGNSIERISAKTTKITAETDKSTQSVQKKTRALSEEQKEEQRLAAAIDKVVRVRNDSNKAITEANLKAREVQREVTREIQINQQAEGSIKQIGLQLAGLRSQYENLSRARREDINDGGELLQQIKALDAEYKSLRESTGNFRDSVGNYGKATEGLQKLSQGIGDAGRSAMGMAQSLLAVNQLMSLFGDNTKESSEQARQLQKIIALVSLALSINNNLIKGGIALTNAATISEKVYTIQTRARAAATALATKNTIAATIAQRAFNLVASANPFVLLALAIVAVASALYKFAFNTDDAADKQRRLNEMQSNYLDSLEREATKTVDISNERISALERQLRLLEAQGDKQKEIRKVEDDIARERRRNNSFLRGFYAQELEDLDKNRQMLDKYKNSLEIIRDLKSQGATKIDWDVNYGDNIEQYDVEEAIQLAQSKIDQYGRVVEIAVGINTENLELDSEDEVREARRIRETSEAAKKRAETELSILRAAEDSRIKLIEDSNERTRKTLEISYDRQIEDIRRRLKTEKDITTRARIALNETITNLEKQKGSDIEKLEREQAASSIQLRQEVEDSRLSLIIGSFDRQMVEINLQYDRQIEAYNKRLEEDKSLTEDQQEQITELILNAQKARGIALSNLMADQLNQQTDRELSAIDNALTQTQERIGDFVARNKGGLQLIDVDKTRKNLDESNKALGNYIEGLIEYMATLRLAHEATLDTLQEGSEEYITELERFKNLLNEINKKIKDANKQREDNTKASNGVLTEYFRDLFEKIGKYAEAASMAVSSVVDTFTMGLELQIESLNEQLEQVSERYEEVVKMREESTERVEELEQRLRDATGGSAEALKEQLQSEIQARAELEREEARLAKEKEKREAEIAKKEKQQRRADLVNSITSGIANTASAVIKALDAAPPPFNFVLAALVGAAGAVQTGIMAKQLSKLEDGGLITGPSHANGGARIHGTDIEVEGGEFVVNKKSTAANARLIEFINNSRSTVTASDLVGILPGETAAPVMINNTGTVIDYDALAEAISNINITPVVAVTDIIEVQDTQVTVRDIAGY